MCPPEARVLHRQVGGAREMRPLAVEDHGVLSNRVSVGGGKGDVNRYRLFAREPLRFNADGDRSLLPVRGEVERVEVDARDGGSALAVQLYGAPDPDSREPRSPVPPEAELRLAHKDAFGVASPLVGVLFASVIQRSVEEDGEGILLPETHLASHVEDGLPEHIGVTSDLLAVEPDGGESVEALEDEAQPLVELKRFFGPVKTYAIPPLAILDPGAPVFVTVVEGVLDVACGYERAVDVSWHRHVEPVGVI